MLVGYPLTKKPDYQGGIKIEKNGTLTAHCRYGDETEVHVTVLWAERPVANIPCATMREYMKKLNTTEGRTVVTTYASATRWAAVSFSTKILGRIGEIRGLADEMLKQVEPRALQCPLWLTQIGNVTTFGSKARRMNPTSDGGADSSRGSSCPG